MVLLLVVGTAIAVFVATVIVLTLRNARKADELSALNARMEAIKILNHALEYLYPLGSGHNLEWTNAREIIELALMRVMFEGVSES